MKRINMSGVATGIAATSLFIALGGPAEAASLITGSNIQNGTVTGADIKNSSLTGSDVKNNGLTGLDIKNLRGGDITDGSLRSADFAKGQLPAGPQGPAGAPGPKGDTGPEGPSRWLLVNRAGQIEAQSGGFRIANAYPALPSPGNGNVYIESGDKDLSNNGIVATIALENQYSLKEAGATGATGNAGANPEADNNPEFSGEIGATKCAITGVVACAPLDTGAGVTPAPPTNANNYLVVSPRLSDGRRTSGDSAAGAGDNTRKRFYVVLSGPRD